MPGKKRGPKPRYGQNMEKYTVWLPPAVAAWLVNQTGASSEGLAIQTWLVNSYPQAAQPKPSDK